MSTQMNKQPYRGMEFQGRESVGETPSQIFQFMFAKHDAAIPPPWLSLLFINAILYSVQIILKICFAQVFYGVLFISINW